jgi:hypothetical protein
MKALRIVGWVILGLAGITAIGLLVGIIVQLLWNWLMPAIFGLPEISYWQGVGLFILFKILFGGHHPHHKKNGTRQSGHRFADRVREKMTCSRSSRFEEDEELTRENTSTQE